MMPTCMDKWAALRLMQLLKIHTLKKVILIDLNPQEQIQTHIWAIWVTKIQ